MRSKPFARAIAMMGIISAAMSSGMPAMSAIAGLPEYKSRGHGLGKHSGKKWGPSSSGKYAGVFNGRRECERRMRQMGLFSQKAKA